MYLFTEMHGRIFLQESQREKNISETFRFILIQAEDYLQQGFGSETSTFLPRRPRECDNHNISRHKHGHEQEGRGGEEERSKIN